MRIKILYSLRKIGRKPMGIKEIIQRKDQPGSTQAFDPPSVKEWEKIQNENHYIREVHHTPGFQKSIAMPRILTSYLPVKNSSNIPRISISEQISEEIRLHRKKETQK